MGITAAPVHVVHATFNCYAYECFKSNTSPCPRGQPGPIRANVAHGFEAAEELPMISAVP